MAMVMMMARVTAMAMVRVMSNTVAMMAVRNGGDALGYGDDDGNDAMAVRLMTAMMAMTLWKRTVRDVPIPARVQVCNKQWRHRQTQQTCNTWLVIYRTPPYATACGSDARDAPHCQHQPAGDTGG